MTTQQHVMPHYTTQHHTTFFSIEELANDQLPLLTDINFSEAIKELSANSAAGPDGLPASLLMNCCAELTPILAIIFKESFTKGVIPMLFKRAAIVPIFKSGDKTQASNYRPISLTSVVCKVFERVIRKQVFSYLSEHNFLNETQHGFRGGRSCLSALLDVYDDIMHMISGGDIVIIYVWKVLQGLVPNFSHPIIATLSDRRGRSCTISNVNVGRKGTLAFNSFRWRSIRMFNGLPKYLQNITLCSVNSFKTQLDSHLIKIPDLPSLPGNGNSLDRGNCAQRWTQRDDLAVE